MGCCGSTASKEDPEQQEAKIRLSRANAISSSDAPSRGGGRSAKQRSIAEAAQAQEWCLENLGSELAERRLELQRVEQQEAELRKSEEALARRLWEVQETRRRHGAIKEQLLAAVEAAEAALGLAAPAVSRHGPSARAVG